jgi:DNA modification methylase
MADKVEQLSFSYENRTAQTGPVTCLGMTFENDDARRSHFKEELRRKLPELRLIEGFPHGEDEDILALSDPPYYTACPNPWISEMLQEWKSSNSEGQEDDSYHREPFSADVSEGKNDPIYNAYSYHTKVPYKAIMRYILHYTKPGDIVYDGFCGTGMTGVAAQMCGDRDEVLSLGYQVDSDRNVLKEETDEEGKRTWVPFSRLGARHVLLNDLSPAATFIAANYNKPVDIEVFEREIKGLLADVEREYGWVNQTRHTDGQTGRINFVVWSDVFVCPDCSNEIVFWDIAVDQKAGKVKDEFSCSHCNALLSKRSIDRAWLSKYDVHLHETIKQAKQVPVLINYQVGKKRFEKSPDDADKDLMESIEQADIPGWIPTYRMMEGKETRRNDPIGVTHVHHYYTKRNLLILSYLYQKIQRISDKGLQRAVFSVFNSVQQRHCKMNSFRFNVSFPSNIRSGTLYISSLTKENNFLDQFSNKAIKRLKPLYQQISHFEENMIQTSSAENIQVEENSLDYIFIDPPFGANLNYSELNSIWEAWLKVSTNNKQEAIENSVQGKYENEYRAIMTLCFKEAFRILKPGRWMTVEFSNTKASVWNTIQTAITEAGFVVANVSALDKGGNSIMALTTATAVKQDLVISAYKPNEVFEEKFESVKSTEEGVWDFVRSHLNYLPITKMAGSSLVKVTERDPRILFDQMVAFYVRRGFPVPISSASFQAGLAARFIERDGMFFLPEQSIVYDKKKAISGEPKQLTIFVSDEQSAIEWLRQQLLKKPQARQDLHPNYMKEIQHIAKHELVPELDLLLEQNFLRYDGDGDVPSQIHAYLSTDYKDLRGMSKNDPKLKEKAKDRWYVPDPNKQSDLEKLREKSLLREFNQYVEELANTKTKLKQFRTEAIRLGFYKAWSEKNYQIIVDIGNRLPESILQEDEKLLRYYDNAMTKLGL